MTKRSIERSEPVVPIRFAHAVLRTYQFRAMVDWYKTFLQADVVFANDFICFMTYDDEHHRIAIAQIPEDVKAPPGAAGVDHLAYTYASLGDLLHTYVRLKEAGILPVWPINHGPTTSLYYADPDGTRIEIQYDNYKTPAELKGWFETGAFAKNPIGTTYDPEKLLQKYLDGVPLEELIQQGSA